MDEKSLPELPASTEKKAPAPVQKPQNMRLRLYLFAGIGLILLAILVVGIYFLSTTGLDTTGRIRDIFIILMALESIVIGLALIILIVQLATLINLLQNEIKPILNSTSDTVNTLKGTATFLSENLVEPVIKMNEYLAGLKKIFEILKLMK